MLSYRSEIDGLRAIAVMAVVVFHAGWGWSAGGFVGVDVFFVISGYLITSILLSDLKASRFSFMQFYERRARRLLPSLFLVTLCTIPLAYVLMLPHQFEDFSKSVVGVGVFLSNFQFWWEAGYFETAAELKPLLHTWSLAVEEQFYLLFPVLLLLLYRRKLLLTIAVLSILSLFASEWVVRRSPDSAFFLLPFRAWELFAGAICAQLPLRKNNWAAGFGLGLIVLSMGLYGPETRFPGFNALLPVAGTALVLSCAQGTWVARLLSVPALVTMGLISYSVYLWHQPLFAFARLATTGAPKTWVMISLCVASIALGWLTWKFVEQPFRRGRPLLPGRRSLLSSAFAAMACLTVLGATVTNEAYFWQRVEDRESALLAWTRFSETDRYRQSVRLPDCMLGADAGLSVFSREICLTPATDVPNILLIGDSHAAHLWEALHTALDPALLMQVNGSACRPMSPAEGLPFCIDMIDMVLTELQTLSVDHVVLSARWWEDDVVQLQNFIRLVQSMGHQVTVIGPTEEYQAALPVILFQLGERSDLAEAVAVHNRADRFELSRALGNHVRETGAVYVDALSMRCPEDICPPVTSGGVPTMWDREHFSPEGALEAVHAMLADGQLTHLSRP